MLKLITASSAALVLLSGCNTIGGAAADIDAATALLQSLKPSVPATPPPIPVKTYTLEK